MPDKKDVSLAMQEKKMLKALIDLLAELYGYGRVLPSHLSDIGSSLQSMCLAIKDAGTLLRNEPDKPVSDDRLAEIAKRMNETKKRFARSLQNALNSREIKEQDHNRYQTLCEIAEVFAKNRSVVASYQNTVNTLLEITRFQERAASLKDQPEELKDHTRSFDLEGVRPAFEECVRPRIADQPEMVFRHMLWLSRHCGQTEYGENGSFYQETLDRMRQTISDSPRNVQLEFAKLINGTAQAYRARNKLDHAFCTLAGSFADTPVGQELRHINPEAMTMPAQIQVPEKTEATPRQKELSSLASFYGKLTADTRSASNSFRAISENLGALMAMHHEHLEGIPDEKIGEYNLLLSQAADAVNLYVSSHKTNPLTEKGKDRIRLARALQRELNRQQSHLKDRLGTMEQDKSVGGLAEDGSLTVEQADKFAELAKVQRHILPVRMVPKNPEYQAEPSKSTQALRSAGHSLVSGITKLVSAASILGQEKIPELFASEKKEREQAEPQAQIPVPGHEGEVFKVYKDEELHSTIIDDTRRVPLLWEKPIPEDPADPPTVSFNFRQSVEGDDRTNLVGENGHGSITLKYTRKDPISGKDTRYAVTMGLYMGGGFNKFSVKAAMYFNGLHIPASLRDDSADCYNVRKTVPVTNYQINKILLAAQEYEKGGYNSIQRNCTTFVADMAKAGGIDVSPYIQSADFNGTFLGNLAMGIGSGLLAFAGPPLTLAARNELKAKMGKTNLDYKSYGQKMVSPELVKKLGSPYENVRLKGYLPSGAAERIRRRKDYKLSGMDYSGNYAKISKQSSKTSIQNRITAIKQDLLVFEQTLKKHLKKNEKNYDPAVVADVMKFCNSSVRAMDGYAENLAALSGIPSVVLQRKQELCVKLNRTVDDYIDGLNDIFHHTFKGDQQLNVLFSRMASLGELVKHNNLKLYQEARDASPDIDLNRGNRGILRAFFSSKYSCPVHIAGTEKPVNISLTAGQVIGAIRAFGSLEKYGKQYAFKSAQGKEKSIFERKETAMNSFAAAEKYFFSGKPLTAEDYRLAFADLPKTEKTLTLPFQNAYTLSQIYQSEIFNRILGGICPRVRQWVKDVDKKQIAGQEKPFFAALAEDLGRAFSSEDAKQSVQQMKEALLPGVIDNLQSKHEELNARNIENALTDKIFGQMTSGYLRPMFWQIASGDGMDDIGLNKESGTAFFNMTETMKKSSELEKIKKQIAGISISEKIDEALQKNVSAEVAHGSI